MRMGWKGKGPMVPHWRTLTRIMVATSLVAFVIFACTLIPIDKILKDFILWVQRDVGPWGPLIYALAYVVCTVFVIPASLLTLGGGYLYGLVIGFITDSIGSTAGATAAFIVGRTIGKSYVTAKLGNYPQFRNIALAIEKSGFKIVLLLRMVPLLPFNVLNYLLSVTPISCYTYTLASWLGMMDYESTASVNAPFLIISVICAALRTPMEKGIAILPYVSSKGFLPRFKRSLSRCYFLLWLWASALAFARECLQPMTLVFVYAGTTIKDIADFSRHGGHFTPARWVLLGAGLFTSGLVVILVTRVAKNALHRAVLEGSTKAEELA